MRAASSLRMTTERRGILLHDGLAFLALLAITIVLYLMTLFLFRSFEAHREDLGVRWADRGRASLAAGKPADAIYSLRTALSYKPEDRADQLLLAQALASDGRVEEATNYFENLWEQTPGDGFINLQLARLARGKKEVQAATNYYRAAIFGNWQGDGPVRRREVRVELADYLTAQHELTAARAELFIAAANNPQDEALSLAVADRLYATGDLPDALVYADKAVRIAPNDVAALTQAGRAAYALGQFAAARHDFERALETAEAQAAGPAEALRREQLEAMTQHARRALELTLSRNLPQAERATHLLQASAIAEGRLNGCLVQTTALNAPAAVPTSQATATSAAGKPAGRPLKPDMTLASVPPELALLKGQWTATETPQARRLLVQNADAQDVRVQLIGRTEQAAAHACGQPGGDDAILLMLAGMEQRQTAQDAAGAHGR